jgi:hypothetical protein
MAGREAELGGEWTVACNKVGTHHIGYPGMREPLYFCPEHIVVLIAKGLISDTFLTDEEYEQMAADPNYYGEPDESFRQARETLRRRGLL